MISTPDRQAACVLIEEAVHAGARLRPSCAELGISVRTYRRGHEEGSIKADGRPNAVRPAPCQPPSDEERQRIL